MITRYNEETGHADYPHEPGTLYDCAPCERIMEAQEGGQMDEDTLSLAVEIYVTDPGCWEAVRRYMREHDIPASGYHAAAQEVAKKVAPAPHNTAAHDARYLLAPEAQAGDLVFERNDQILGEEDEDVLTFEIMAQREAALQARDRDQDTGPIPAHPDEAPDERQTLVRSSDITWEQFLLLPEQNQFIQHHEPCGPLCQFADDLAEELDQLDLIPVVPPTLAFEPIDAGTEDIVVPRFRITVTVTAIPARNREVLLTFGYGSQETIDNGIAWIMEMLKNYPTHRLVMRRNPDEEHAVGVIYRQARQTCPSCGFDHNLSDGFINQSAVFEVPAGPDGQPLSSALQQALSAVLGRDLPTQGPTLPDPPEYIWAIFGDSMQMMDLGDGIGVVAVSIAPDRPDSGEENGSEG